METSLFPKGPSERPSSRNAPGAVQALAGASPFPSMFRTAEARIGPREPDSTREVDRSRPASRPESRDPVRDSGPDRGPNGDHDRATEMNRTVESRPSANAGPSTATPDGTSRHSAGEPHVSRTESSAPHADGERAATSAGARPGPAAASRPIPGAPTVAAPSPNVASQDAARVPTLPTPATSADTAAPTGTSTGTAAPSLTTPTESPSAPTGPAQPAGSAPPTGSAQGPGTGQAPSSAQAAGAGQTPAPAPAHVPGTGHVPAHVPGDIQAPAPALAPGAAHPNGSTPAPGSTPAMPTVVGDAAADVARSAPNPSAPVRTEDLVRPPVLPATNAPAEAAPREGVATRETPGDLSRGPSAKSDAADSRGTAPGGVSAKLASGISGSEPRSPGAAGDTPREPRERIQPAAAPTTSRSSANTAPVANDHAAPATLAEKPVAGVPTADGGAIARSASVEAAPSAASAKATGPTTTVLRAVPGLEVQLAAKSRELLDRGRTEVRIALNPPALGKLRIRLEISEGRAVAHIVAATPEAAALLNREREDLMKAFQEQGFEDVDVHVDAEHESAARDRDGGDEDEDGPTHGTAPSSDRAVRSPRRANTMTTRSVDLFV